MTNDKMPTDAPGWSAFLLSQPLPTPFRIGQLTLKQMAKEKLAYSTIAERLNHDPVISFLIMEAAGKQSIKASSEAHEVEYSKTLDHAISMVGTDKVHNIIKQAPFQKPSTDKVQSIYYVQTLSRALLSAELAKHLAQAKGQFNPQDLYWAALFSYVPDWYLWYFALPEMRLTRYAVNTSRLARTKAQIEVFGCSIEDITKKVVEDLALPPIVKSAYSADNQISHREWVQISRHNKSSGQLVNQIDDRDFKMRLQQPNFIVQLAKLVADSAMRDWYSRATRRSIRVFAAYLDLTNSEATKICHELATEVSRSHPIPGILLPAARLFLPPIEFVPNKPSNKTDEERTEEEEPKEAVKPEPTKSEVLEDGDLIATEEVLDPDANIPSPIYSQLIETMFKKPEGFADVHELMNSATTALIYGLELGRATVSLVDKERTHLKTYYATGCEPDEPLADYQVKLIKGSLFAKLCSKQASLWVKESTDPKVLSLIPSNFKQATGLDSYFLMSVFVKDRPFAMIYADAPTGGHLTEKKYKHFKYACKAVGHALEWVTSKTKSG